MAKDYANTAAKKRVSSKGKSSSVSWKMAISTGVLLLLFAGGLYYLSQYDVRLRNAGAKKAPPKLVKQKTTEQPKQTRPRFEFYTLLPKSETPSPDVVEQQAEKVEIPVKSKPQLKTQPTPHYTIQVGSFQQAADADRLKAELTLLGFDVKIITFKYDNVTWYRVRLGPFASSSNAQIVQEKLRGHNFTSFVQEARA